MSKTLVKNDDEAIFTDKKRHRFKRHNGQEAKGDVDSQKVISTKVAHR